MNPAAKHIVKSRKGYITFRDSLGNNLKVLFVGLNPSPVSLEKGHYLQGVLGKRFWGRLRKYGIIDEDTKGREDDFLKTYHFGITDLVKRPSRRFKEISSEEIARGRKKLTEKVKKYRPRIICFVYKTAADIYFQEKLRSPGLLTRKIAGSRVFVMPSVYADKATISRYMHAFKKLLG